MKIDEYDSFKVLEYEHGMLSDALLLFKEGGFNGIRICPNWRGTNQILDEVSQFNSIKTLSIQRLPEAPIQSLGDFPNLEYLSIDETKVEVDFEKLPNLLCFSGAWHKGRFKNIQLSKLKELRLRKYKSITNDLMELTAFSELEELELVQSTVTSLHGISAFKDLTRFEMHYMNKLETLGELDLPKLTFLHADFCKKITDHEKLQGCQNLETLRLHNCGAIKSVQFIKNLKKLKSFRFMEASEVVDGDLSPLLDLADVLFTQKKHYSHKTKDFNQHA